MKWQPIETAPHDQPILVYCTAGGGELYGTYDDITPFYDVVNGGPIKDPGYEPTGRDANTQSGNWWYSTGEYYETYVWPTHWMPLPPAPEEE